MFNSCKTALQNQTKRFINDERGGIIIFSLFMMVCMLLAVGLSIDVVRTEHMRTRLQNTADVAVLAAANLNQTRSADDVVQDYFDRAGLGPALQNVSTGQGFNQRSVTAEASFDVPSMFLNMVGIDSLSAPAISAANEAVNDVEISLVLDISASMVRNNRMPNLRNAASTFVDLVINDERPGSASISLVPYTAQVNAGPAIMDQMNVTPLHNYSHCVDFEDADFAETSISLTREHEHMQHYQYANPRVSPIRNPECPMQDYERIKAFSENKVELTTQLSQLQPRANTSIHLGMKWGVALLDPAARPMVNNLIAAGESDASFAGRPFAYDRDNSMKVVILMTDGENVLTRRIRPQYYDTPEERVDWNTYRMFIFAQRLGLQWPSVMETKYTAAQADSLLENICDAAKAKGIIVYTVGFEVSNDAALAMQNCASSPGLFFSANGTEIVTVFENIARSISQLRLTQ